MSIVFYCQHVLGIGHFFRSLEICRALAPHPVTLVTGGPRLEVPLPRNVTELRLPEITMDREFKALRAAAGADLHRIRDERRRALMSLFVREKPALFMLELYPFGRKAFAAEIDPLLEAISSAALPTRGVVCSVRDILVEKEKPEKHEARTVAILNRHFDAVLVHSDPRLIRLEETFGRIAELRVPVVYTGLVAPAPPPDARRQLRRRLGLAPEDRLVVASAGGGSVGAALLSAVLRAFARRDPRQRAHLAMFTGPFLPEAEFRRLEALSGPGVTIARFTPEFPAHLAAADLSVSMGGYNTTMNILAAGTPALVWPFAQNREQRMRAERLQALGALALLADADLDPGRLAGRMEAMLSGAVRPKAALDLAGAENTARWVETWFSGGGRRPRACGS
jgi:predicted glycosyltransferase